MTLVNLRDYEVEASKRLDPVYFDYFASGAQDEVTVAANEAAFKARTLIPRVLRGCREPRLDTVVFGRTMELPVLLAPTAFHRLAHAEGELATARAAARAHVTMIAAMLSTVSLEEIAKTGASLWFQLYFQPDLEFTETLVRRAEKASCRALVITVDSPALGRNERGDRNGFHALPPGITCPNLGDEGDVRSVVLTPEISWWHVDWLREITSLPIVLKGVLHPTDARIALDHGVDGIIVSNHGGRQLDTTPATLDRLPVVVDAVEGAIPVMMDGGIRRGTDIAKAVALGAAAVAIGRPALWGLAVGGQDGVTQVLELLRNELVNALTLLGSESPGHLTRDQVEP